MGYIEETLLPGEKIICKAKFHWIIYAPGIAFILTAIALYAVTGNRLAAGLVLLGAIIIMKSHIQRKSMEFAVTNKRIVAKVGWFSRTSMETPHNRVGSILLDQTVMGRLLNYGTLSINGLGSGSEYFTDVADPVNFRNKAMQAIEEGR